MDTPTDGDRRCERPYQSHLGKQVEARNIYELLDHVGAYIAKGFSACATCPGEQLHGVETYADDCIVIHDRETGETWIECDHHECAFEVEAANFRLANLLLGRERIENRDGSLPDGDEL